LRVAKVEWVEEGGVGAWYVECPTCHHRIALVKGYEPPGSIEEMLNDALRIHLAKHAAGVEPMQTRRPLRPERRREDGHG
jgi:hypothetical protein